MMTRILLLAGFFASSGCGATAKQIAVGGVTVVRTCASEGLKALAEARQGIHDGTNNWLEAVFTAVSCGWSAANVVAAEIKEHGCQDIQSCDMPFQEKARAEVALNIKV